MAARESVIFKFKGDRLNNNCNYKSGDKKTIKKQGVF
jgi:hypothetical protein